jgi:Uma2 family endonuclease
MRDADWDTYQAMLLAVGDRPIRITYDRGVLELMSPLPIHERLKKLIDRLLFVAAEEFDVSVVSLGSTTFNRESLDRGLEPDECYYIQHKIKIRGRHRIDLNVDPPPDLAIEVDVYHSSIDRMSIYAALGIPEVWRYDDKKIQVLRLNRRKQYVEAHVSTVFHQMPISELSRLLERWQETDDNTLARGFRKALRKKTANGK